MSEINKIAFARICKIDEVKQEVWGIATQEIEDCAGEICDLPTSWPYFEEWSNHASEATGGVSKGNLREMHQLIAAGRLIDIQKDANSIHIGAKIVDPTTWEKVKERVLIGFSIGGVYIKRWKDPDNKNVMRFTAKPSEISIVDLPCVPTALIDSIKAAKCELVKADGSTETVNLCKEASMPVVEPWSPAQMSDFASKLDDVWSSIQALKKDGKTKRVAGEDLGPGAFAYVGDSDDPSTWKLPIKFSSEEKTKRHIRNALARFNQTKGIPDGEKEKVHARIVAAAKKHGIDAEETEKAASVLSDLLKSALEKAAGDAELTKSLGNIADMVFVLQNLYWIRMDAEWEALYEGGDGDERDEAVAVELRALIEHAVEILKEIVDEETAELSVAVGKAQAAEKEAGMKVDELLKAADSLHGHFKKAAAHHEKKADLHKSRFEYHKAKMDECKANGESGMEEVKKLHKSMEEDHKHMMDHHEEEHKVHKSMAEHCTKMAERCAEKAMDAEALKAAADKEAADALAKKAADDAAAAKAAADEVAKAAEAAAPGSGTTIDPGKEKDNMTNEEVTKAVQDAVSALDLKKTVSEAVAAAVAEVKASVATSIKEEVAKAVPAATEVKTYAIPRVSEAIAKAASTASVSLKSENDNGW